MRVYIQSRTGNYNTVNPVGGSKVKTLEQALSYLRAAGGYYVTEEDDTEEVKFVPFEEIEYINESKDE